MTEISEQIKELLQSCFLPELKQDLDTVPIQSEHFIEYRQALEVAAPLLYDLVQQNEQVIFLQETEETQELLAYLLILLCEITAPHALYKLANESLLKNANRLLGRHAKYGPTVEHIIFRHYQSKLKKNVWKRQLGAVHGFLRFLEFRHNDSTRNSYKMSTNWLNFSLSVALTVRECHEPLYKQIANEIFQIMLNYAEFDDIQNLNIHSVIYDVVFKDVHVMDSVVATAGIWTCLFRCLDFFQELESTNWGHVDDMMEVLMRTIPLTSDSLISLCLLKFVTKLSFYFSINRHDIEEKCHADLRDQQTLSEYRQICSENTSYVIFRWAKSVLELFIVDSYKLMQSPNICEQLLLELHRCYMACIWPINLPIIAPHLLPFYDKFTAVLMEVLVVQKHKPTITMLVKDFITTFQQQLARQLSLDCEKNARVLKFHAAFNELLQQSIF